MTPFSSVGMVLHELPVGKGLAESHFQSFLRRRYQNGNTLYRGTCKGVPGSLQGFRREPLWWPWEACAGACARSVLA